MTTHITFPDIDYTAIVAEANSFLASQPFNEASNELTIHPFPLATLDSLEEIIPSLFTTFVDKNLSIRAANIIIKPATCIDVDKIHHLSDYMLHIPLTSGINENLTFFDVVENEKLKQEWRTAQLLSYYDRADCTEIGVVELQQGVGILVNNDSIVHWESTATTAFINIRFNEDISSYFA